MTKEQAVITVFTLIGYVLLFRAGWEIAVGVFFLEWARNYKAYVQSPKYAMDKIADAFKSNWKRNPSVPTSKQGEEK